MILSEHQQADTTADDTPARETPTPSGALDESTVEAAASDTEHLHTVADVAVEAPDAVAPAAQTFADLGIHPDVVAALRDHGIVHPFPIQAMAIPIAVTGTDMIGQARTGTGKTLAFGVSLLQRIVVPGDRDFEAQAKPGAPQALVVAPTRELAGQVSQDLATASAQRRARVLTVYGGVGYEPQLDGLAAGVEIVVGTPGRLLDLADRRALDLSHIKVVVLDEADEMLDLGFLPDVERLLAKTPELRQTMLFSATMPSAIVSLARRHLRHPVNIRAESAGEETTVPTTAQFVYQAHDLDKPEVVARILQAEGRDRCMIFCRTKRAAQRVADDLAERGFAAAPIHGDLNQVAREKALGKFRDGSVDVLVATDVAARGIDVANVTHVINYECPDDDKTYVHRIGRTGRAGASGVAITFVDWADGTRWKVINKTLGLPFEEPQETYSTSEHLYHDLGIAPGTRGRLVPARQSESQRPPRRRSDEGTERPREPRRRSTRQRRRTHNGQPVTQSRETDSAATGTVPVSTAPSGTAATGAARGEASVGGESASSSGRRRRRRRRTGTGHPDAATRGADAGREGATTPVPVES